MVTTPPSPPFSLQIWMNNVSDQDPIYSPCNLEIQNIYNPTPPKHNTTYIQWVWNNKNLILLGGKKQTLLDFSCLTHTICFCCYWNSNYISICDPFMVSIQTNFVATHLERRKPSHVNHGCVRSGFNGVWIRVMIFRLLGRFFRFEASIQKDHELIDSGPYTVVRHPSYAGLMLVFIGWFPWQLDKGSWVMESGLWNTTFGRMFVMVYFIIFHFGNAYLVPERMSKEDIALKNKFGSKWDDWAKRVPYTCF